MLGKFFGWAEYVDCPPSVIVGWATAHPAPQVPAALADDVIFVHGRLGKSDASGVSIQSDSTAAARI